MSQDALLTIWLPPHARAFTAGRAEALGAKPILERTYMSRAELRENGDADAGLWAEVAAQFRAQGAVSVERAWRRVIVRGPRVTCARAAAALQASRLASRIDAIFGLDDPPSAVSLARESQDATSDGLEAGQVARAYRLPQGLDGTGTSLGLLHLSGTFRAEDFEVAMRAAKVKLPRCVRRGEPAPSTEKEDREIALDSQIAGSLAPGATLVLYRGTETARSYADTIASVLLDEVEAPSVLSISYGDPENRWSPGALVVLDRLFVAAALCGITVVAASGDGGSGSAAHAEPVVFPASSRFVLACGGTTLRLEGGRRSSERVWQERGGASGGGYSRAFPRTPWHPSGDRGEGRGVPDVAAHAGLSSGYRIRLHGTWQIAGGTSAAAPLWAAFVALANQRLGMPCGFFTPLLYERAPTAAFTDITMGSSGHYHARAGWDPCTGLGSPNFTELLEFFTQSR